MNKYVFLSNSSKPSLEENESLKMIKLTNVSKPCVEIAHELGYEIFLGVNRKFANKISVDLPFNVSLYDSHTYRSILNFKDNYIAYNNLNVLINDEKIDVIHCNTPVGGLIGRLCGKRNHVKKIIYTAHGFHFYKGAPIFNNTILKLAEKIMARWTDAIITMNKEDYEAAKRFKLKEGGKVFFVHGVGIDVNKINTVNIDKTEKRIELGISKDDYVLISVGDINKNKNIGMLLDIVKKLNNPNIKVLICGKGPLIDKLNKKAKNDGVESQIHFLGYRNDVIELFKASDIYISTSKREGLPRALMEAMSCGLPCVVSDVRGNVDLIDDKKGGFVSNSLNSYINSINSIIYNRDLSESMKEYNLNKIKNYDYDIVKKEIYDIYKNCGI